MQTRRRRESLIQQPRTPIHQTRGSRTRDAQTTRDLTRSIPPPRRQVAGRYRTRIPASLGLPAVSIPLSAPVITPRRPPRQAAHLRATGQAHGSHRLGPLRPSSQTAARRYQLAQTIRTQIRQSIGAPIVVDHQRLRGLHERPLAGVHHIREQPGTCAAGVDDAVGGAGSPSSTATDDRGRRRGQKRRHQALNRTRQSGTRRHPRQTRRSTLIRSDAVRQHTDRPARGIPRGRAGSTPTIEHMYRLRRGCDTKTPPLTALALPALHTGAHAGVPQFPGRTRPAS